MFLWISWYFSRRYFAWLFRFSGTKFSVAKKVHDFSSLHFGHKGYPGKYVPLLPCFRQLWNAGLQCTFHDILLEPVKSQTVVISACYTICCSPKCRYLPTLSSILLNEVQKSVALVAAPCKSYSRPMSILMAVCSQQLSLNPAAQPTFSISNCSSSLCCFIF